MDLKKLINDYIQKGIVMQLATVKDNKPWICTVHIAKDEKMNIYWMSLANRRHSLEIAENMNVAGAIVNDPNITRCVHFEGTAQLLVGEEANEAIRLYCDQTKKTDAWRDEVLSGKNLHKVYKLSPKTFVLFDAVNFPENPRQEYKV